MTATNRCSAAFLTVPRIVETLLYRGFRVACFLVFGSPGSVGMPAQLTIIAEGSIDISGSPDIIPDALELLFVTDGDLDITGNVTTHGPGQILVHEQIRLSGSPFLDVQIIVENATSVDPLVEANSIGGTTVLVYNGGLGAGLLTVNGWRDVR